MSRFSLSSSLALFQSVLNTDPDATNSSSTSSCSAFHNSSNSLSVSPATEREIKLSKQSHQISNHLLALQREIKEEEDEIFADINSLINNRSDLYSSLEDADFEDAANINCSLINSHYLQEDQGFIEEVETELIEAEDEQAIAKRHKEEFENSYTEEEQQQQSFVPCNQRNEQQFHQEHSLLLTLEDAKGDDPSSGRQELSENPQEQDDYQAINQQRDIQQLASNLPKPCVFFLEGNCRRSDCKYSHDLSSITCKYWLEGFCFKGEMCPFSHSFAPIGGQDSSLLDDDELLLSKKNLDPTFTIESEADFPSLPLDSPNVTGDAVPRNVDANLLATTIKTQILSSNSSVVFKTTKKKRRRG